VTAEWSAVGVMSGGGVALTRRRRVERGILSESAVATMKSTRGIDRRTAMD